MIPCPHISNISILYPIYDYFAINEYFLIPNKRFD